MTNTTYVKGSPTLTFSWEFAKIFLKKSSLKITSPIIKLGVKNIAIVLILLRKATETILQKSVSPFYFLYMIDTHYFLGISSWLRKVKKMMLSNDFGKSVSCNE